ncbi:MAG: FeoB-associated Cys-rich membrane protein [Flavobacteriaceae bacterium]|nr:FeoB-associated Cys-rich membrane protein [Flavobacteriaceae bacterium]
MQEIIVYIILLLSVAFLAKKFIFKSKKAKKSCDTGCGCA